MQKLLDGHVEPMPLARRVRELYEEIGGECTVPYLRKLILERQVLTQDELSRFVARGLDDKIRTALKVDDENGLPFAGPTRRSEESPSPIWVQRALWNTDDYRVMIVEELRKQRDQLDQKIELLNAECFERFGMKF